MKLYFHMHCTIILDFPSVLMWAFLFVSQSFQQEQSFPFIRLQPNRAWGSHDISVQNETPLRKSHWNHWHYTWTGYLYDELLKRANSWVIWMSLFLVLFLNWKVTFIMQWFQRIKVSQICTIFLNKEVMIIIFQIIILSMSWIAFHNS